MKTISRDITLEAVSDGLYVSPAIETADYHASLNKNSWFYVFDYQAKYGDYTTVSIIIAHISGFIAILFILLIVLICQNMILAEHYRYN